MKILFLQWHSFMNRGIEKALKELGIEYDLFFYQFTDWERDEKFSAQMMERLKSNTYNMVLSVNFSPLVSNVCEDVGILYISWVYDCPLHIRNLEPLKHSCNRIYFFDRGQAEEYRRQGIEARYMPLAVDHQVFCPGHREDSRVQYKTDISFVGSLYLTEYQRYTAPLEPYLRGYLEGIINAQGKVYGGYLVPELVTPELLDKINENYKKMVDGKLQIEKRELEFLLACETTGRERYMILSLLSKHFDVDLYSANVDERLKDVHYRGTADYYSEMPQIFAGSRINLNISLKAIQTGIPLRAVDIMGCGGFLITNYQVELEEYFETGKECVVYDNLGDLYEKADFYLKHEEERTRIALAGLERVKQDFTFRDRLERMMVEK